jgi:hypothetical protein
VKAALIHADRLGVFRHYANAPKDPNYTKNDPDSYVTMTGVGMEAAMGNIHLYVMVPFSKYRLLHTFFSVTFASTLTSSCLELQAREFRRGSSVNK